MEMGAYDFLEGPTQIFMGKGFCSLIEWGRRVSFFGRGSERGLEMDWVSKRTLSAKELMLLNCGVGEDSWESLGLQGDPASPS